MKDDNESLIMLPQVTGIYHEVFIYLCLHFKKYIFMRWECFIT